MSRMAVGRGPEFERWMQSSAAVYDMLLNGLRRFFTDPNVIRLRPVRPHLCGREIHCAPRPRPRGNNAELAKAWAARMPTARFVGLPNTGHVPRLESPAAFSSAVLEFLR